MKTILSILLGLVGAVSTMVFVKSNEYAPSGGLDPNDSLALVALYEATNGPQWKNSWDLTAPVRTWYGVVLDASGQKVIRLELDNNGLDGYLPEAIGRLDGLVTLRMPRNALKSHMPDSLSSLGSLRQLILFDNQLDGAFPDSMQQMASLRMISLTGNRLDQPLPASMGKMPQLEVLILSNNDIPGPIPASFSDLVSLRTCNMTNNDLTGPLPEQIGHMAALQELLLSNNRIGGSVPASIAQLNSLRYLWLDHNELIDTFPAIQLPQLVSLRLDFNRLTGLPDLTDMAKLHDTSPNGVNVIHNQLSFEDILPNLPLIDSASRFDYWPQDTIVLKDTFYLSVGDQFSYKLPFDDTVGTNTYKWFKYNVQKEITRTNRFTIPRVQFLDAGDYHCLVTNATLDSITLKAYSFTLIIKGNTGCGNPPPADECYLAKVNCALGDLDEYCTQTDRVRPVEIFSFCGKLMPLADRDWFAFKAGATHARIRITPFSCSTDPGSGLVALVFEDCSLGTPLNCDTFCTQSTIDINLEGLTVGKDYYLLIGGCAGGCYYQISIKEGGEGVQLEEPGSIRGQDSICDHSAFYNYTLDSSIDGAVKYEWSITDEAPVYTLLPKLNTQWPSPGSFRLCVRGVGLCDTTEYSCRIITVFPELTYEDLNITSVSDQEKYYVEFRIMGGIAPYVISGQGGTYNVVNRTFTSDLIACGTPYSITVTDGNKCSFTLEGTEYCSCTTEAGTLFGDDTLVACEGAAFKVFGNNDATLDSNDIGVFIWYEMVKDGSFDNIIELSDNGVFHYNDQLVELNKAYRIQYLVANRTNNGGIDWLDPCLDTTPAHILFYQPRPEAFAGKDTTVCFGNFNLNARFTSPGSEGRWQFISGPDTPQIVRYKEPGTSVHVISPGKYRFSWLEIQGTCIDGDTVEVTVRPPVQLDIEGARALCEGLETRLEVGAPFEHYLWSTGDTGRAITVTKPGFYGITVTDAFGCTADKTIELKTKQGPQPIITGETKACSGDTLQLRLRHPYTSYRWSNGETGAIAHILQGGIVCVTVTDEDGCEGDDCTEISFADATTTLLHETLCFGDSIVVGGKPVTQAGRFVITLPNANSNGCDSTIIVEVDTLPEIVLVDTLLVHDDGSHNGLINIQIAGGKPPYEYLWNNGSKSSFVKNLSAGSYSVTVTDANLCTRNYDFVIKDLSATKRPSWASEMELDFYPNTVSRGEASFFTYRSSSPVKLQLVGYSLSGKTVFTKRLFSKRQSQTERLDATTMARGVYFVSVQRDGAVIQSWRWVVH